MKKNLFPLLSSAACAVLLFSGCFSSSGDSEPYEISLTKNDTATADLGIFTFNTGKKTYLDYSISAESATDLYLVFSNPSYTQSSSSVILGNQNAAASRGSVSPAAADTRILSPENRPRILMDRPGADSFCEPLFTERSDSTVLRSPARSSADNVNETKTFYDDSGSEIQATCRHASGSDILTAQGYRRLSVWVADECWYDGGTKKYLVTQGMVDALAASFLNAGAWSSGVPQKADMPTGASSYDIYGLVTSVFGAEWGAHGYTNLIASDGQITILLYDIDGDDPTDAGVIGFFAPQNCYTNAYAQKKYFSTNERAMFYIDAPMFARQDSATWSIADYWPSAAVSTLAHEFQHMIQFYQKRVLRGASSSETWLNEMCSLVAEDLVSSYIGIKGPRNIAYTDATAGSATGIIKGRLADMAGASGYYLFKWPSTSDSSIYAAYGQAYALGAYLARSFGGAPLFTRIVQNGYTDKNAVSNALAVSGIAESFDSAFAKWGAAMLVSDSTSTPSYYRYNRGDWFTSSAGGIDYKLGSINLFNYTNGYVSGPYIYTEYTETALPAGSQLLYSAGSLAAGETQSWKITLPAGTILTVVAK